MRVYSFFCVGLGLFLASSACSPKMPAREEQLSRDQALPGMPPIIDPTNIYSETAVGKLAGAVRSFPERVYVPNSGSNTVDVIDPSTFKVVNHFSVGRQPQHVTPSWDLKSLWVLSDLGDTITRIEPATGLKRETIAVKDPYNMYYTPDGKYAIVVAEREKELDFYDAETMKRGPFKLSVPCRGVDHMDFTADGRYLIASCEFSGELVKVDVAGRSVVSTLQLTPPGSGAGPRKGKRVHRGGARMPVENDRMPQDVKTSPDGKVVYVADMMADGVHVIDPDTFSVLSFIPTGAGAHGLYPSRDSKVLYCSNRDEGSISVIDFATRKVIAKWQLPPPSASPDMGGVSADGKVLWLSGRYHNEVYAINTADGSLLARIPVEKGRMGSAYIRSRAAIHLGTMVYSANDLQCCSIWFPECH